jgi:hypothetical protein
VTPRQPWPAPEPEPERADPAVDAFIEAVARRAAELAAQLVLDRLADERERALPFVTYAEAAELAHVSERTIRARVAAGELTRHQLSPARPLVERRELLELMAADAAAVTPRRRRP